MSICLRTGALKQAGLTIDLPSWLGQRGTVRGRRQFAGPSENSLAVLGLPVSKTNLPHPESLKDYPAKGRSWDFAVVHCLLLQPRLLAKVDVPALHGCGRTKGMRGNA